MTDPHESSDNVAGKAVQPSAANAVTDPAIAPMDDTAGGPTADKEQEGEPSEDEVAARLGDFA